MQPLEFDHYTIKVTDLNRSCRFYGDVLGLDEIENRTKKPYIRWFSIGEGNELHIVGGLKEPVRSGVGVHLALRLSDFDAFMDHLERNEITAHNSKGLPGEITVRTDGVRQVYFQDPDGYWIEVNEAGALSE